MQRLNKRDTNTDAMDWADLRERTRTGSWRSSVKQRAFLIVVPRSRSHRLFTDRRGARSCACAAAGGASACCSLIVVIVYYLLSLLGESLARAGTMSPYVGPWLATAFRRFELLFLLVQRIAHKDAPESPANRHVS